MQRTAQVDLAFDVDDLAGAEPNPGGDPGRPAEGEVAELDWPTALPSVAISTMSRSMASRLRSRSRSLRRIWASMARCTCSAVARSAPSLPAW
jgi:hypothetical protein